MKHKFLWMLFGFMNVVHSANCLAANAIVTNCTEAGFNTALATVDQVGGGTMTFNCTSGSSTIVFTNYKQISNANVVIDGGNGIVLNGNFTTSLFQFFSNSVVTLRRITIRNGIKSATHPIENFGNATLDQVQVLSNRNAVGNFGRMTILSSRFESNSSSVSATHGAGVDHQGTELIVRDSSFVTNNATGNGGAIRASANATIENSTFQQNGAANGAGLYASAPVSISQSTFNGNVATTLGGAIYIGNIGVSQINHITNIGNVAVAGGGVYADGGGAGSTTIRNSIVGGNVNSGGNPVDCDGVLISGGYNLSSQAQCGAFSAGTDLLNASLSMAALANNGGPTQTMLLLSNNAAIDRIPAASCTMFSDQRGFARPVNNACDSGAVEVGGAPTSVIFLNGFE